MRGPVQNALRLFTRATRALALRTAGTEGSGTSVIRHTGRLSGRTYETPVVAARRDDHFLIALPYGNRTDWLKNVLGKGSALIMANGHTTACPRPGSRRLRGRCRPPAAPAACAWHSRSAAAAWASTARASCRASATVRPAHPLPRQPEHSPRSTKTRAAGYRASPRANLPIVSSRPQPVRRRSCRLWPPAPAAGSGFIAHLLVIA